MLRYNWQFQWRKSNQGPTHGRLVVCPASDRDLSQKCRAGSRHRLAEASAMVERWRRKKRSAGIMGQELVMIQVVSQCPKPTTAHVVEPSKPENCKTDTPVAGLAKASAAIARNLAGTGAFFQTTRKTPAGTDAAKTKTGATAKRTVNAFGPTFTALPGAAPVLAGPVPIDPGTAPIAAGAGKTPTATDTNKAKAAQVLAAKPKTQNASGARAAGASARVA